MSATATISRDDAPGGAFAGLVFGIVFFYCWLSVNPFEDLTNPPRNVAAINQIAGFLLALALMGYVAIRGRFSFALQPRLMLVLVFGWLAIACVFGAEPGTSLRRLLFTGLICMSASLALVVPRSRDQFDGLVALVSISILLLCYGGVAFLAPRAVHQAYDLVEPALAGDWRGAFPHKNIAAPAMVFVSFFGFYLSRSGARFKGWLIALAAMVFLWNTNGQAALGLFPLSLAASHVLERYPRFGGMAFLGLIAIISTITLGSALSSSIHGLVASLGIDPTFTARTDIWSLALSAAGERPFLGYGFGGFWGSDALIGSDYARQTWAVEAAHAHNGFIEALINGGVPALVLVVLWLVLCPLRDIGSAVRRKADPALTRLFIRIWTFGILSALLESSFFTGTGPVWFTLALAVFGLHQQARSNLVIEPGSGERHG